MQKKKWFREINWTFFHDDYDESLHRTVGFDAASRLNGIGAGLSTALYDHCRREKYYFDYNITELNVLLRKNEAEPVSLERDMGTDYIKLSIAYTYDDLLLLPNDREVLGEALIALYERVLTQIRGMYGIPADFLVTFFEDFRRNGYCVEYEGIKRTFKDHAVRARQIAVCAPDTTETYIAVKRSRSRKPESRALVWVAKERSVRGISVLHDIRFDGANFEMIPVSNREYENEKWTTFFRYKVPLEEFDI